MRPVRCIDSELVEVRVVLQTRFWSPPDIQSLQCQSHQSFRLTLDLAAVAMLRVELSAVVQGVQTEFESNLGAINDTLAISFGPGGDSGQFNLALRIRVAGAETVARLDVDIASLDRFEAGLVRLLEGV